MHYPSVRGNVFTLVFITVLVLIYIIMHEGADCNTFIHRCHRRRG